jgi:hypothetical protein
MLSQFFRFYNQFTIFLLLILHSPFSFFKLQFSLLTMALNPYDGTFYVDVTVFDPNNPNCSDSVVHCSINTLELQKPCWDYGHVLIGQVGFAIPYTIFTTQIKALNNLISHFLKSDDEEGLALMKQHMNTRHNHPPTFDPITDRVLVHFQVHVDAILRGWAEADRVEDFSGDNPRNDLVFHHETILVNPLAYLFQAISEGTECYYREPSRRTKALKAALVNVIKTLHWAVLSIKEFKTPAEQEYFDLVTRVISVFRPAQQNPAGMDGVDGNNGNNA